MIGPSRSGKTVNVISGLRLGRLRPSRVSVKRTSSTPPSSSAHAPGRWRCSDPAGITGIKPEHLTCWVTATSRADTPSGAQKAAAALRSVDPAPGSMAARTTGCPRPRFSFTGLLATASLNPGLTMEDVATWVSSPRTCRSKAVELTVIKDITAAADGDDDAAHDRARWAIKQLDAVWKLDERVRSSVYATLQTVVKPWLDPTVASSAERVIDEDGEIVTPFIDLDWLNAGPNTLYLVAPLADQVRFSPVLGGLIGDLKDQAYQLDVSGGHLARPLLMVIDEAGNMPLSWLPEVASTCAGIGILLVTIWQSKAQLDAAYGKLADSVLTNHLTKIVFAGCSDASTLDYVSRLLGDEEVQRRSVTFDTSGGSGRRSVSEGPQREALAPFHLLRQAEPGHAILIHGTLPPAHLQARRYWQEQPAPPRWWRRGTADSSPAGQSACPAGHVPTSAGQPETPSSTALFASEGGSRDGARDRGWSRWLRRTSRQGATR
ncbi:MAG: TraM recognition domain-containing protein [Ilumatobacteraceae bacterium]